MNYTVPYIPTTYKILHLTYVKPRIHRLPLKDLALYGLRAARVGQRPSSEWNMLRRERLVSQLA